MQRQQQGFTLIELVIVIVILGILSAFALPRFVDLGGDAREATVEGVAGAMRSANSITRSACLAADTATCDETAATATIDLEGTEIDLVYGYPAATEAGIGEAAQISVGNDLTISSDDTVTPPTLTVASDSAPGACEIVFTEAADASTAASVASSTGGCSN